MNEERVLIYSPHTTDHNSHDRPWIHYDRPHYNYDRWRYGYNRRRHNYDSLRHSHDRGLHTYNRVLDNYDEWSNNCDRSSLNYHRSQYIEDKLNEKFFVRIKEKERGKERIRRTQRNTSFRLDAAKPSITPSFIFILPHLLSTLIRTKTSFLWKKMFFFHWISQCQYLVNLIDIFLVHSKFLFIFKYRKRTGVNRWILSKKCQ